MYLSEIFIIRIFPIHQFAVIGQDWGACTEKKKKSSREHWLTICSSICYTSPLRAHGSNKGWLPLFCQVMWLKKNKKNPHKIEISYRFFKNSETVLRVVRHWACSNSKHDVRICPSRNFRACHWKFLRKEFTQCPYRWRSRSNCIVTQFNTTKIKNKKNKKKKKKCWMGSSFKKTLTHTLHEINNTALVLVSNVLYKVSLI